MVTAKRLSILILAIALLAISSCAVLNKKAPVEACINVEDSALPAGIYIGQNFEEARGILGKPLQEIDADFSLASGAIVTLKYPSFDISLSTQTGEVVGRFKWTKPGAGPNPDLLLGEPPRGPQGHTVIYRGMFGDTDEIPTIAICPKPHTRKMRILYSVKGGKIDSIDLQTWKYPW